MQTFLATGFSCGTSDDEMIIWNSNQPARSLLAVVTLLYKGIKLHNDSKRYPAILYLSFHEWPVKMSRLPSWCVLAKDSITGSFSLDDKTSLKDFSDPDSKVSKFFLEQMSWLRDRWVQLETFQDSPHGAKMLFETMIVSMTASWKRPSLFPSSSLNRRDYRKIPPNWICCSTMWHNW